MGSKRFCGWAAAVTLALAMVAVAVVAPGAPAGRADADEQLEKLRRLSYELQKVEPLIHRLEEMEGLIYGIKATSATLEKLEDLEIKADAVVQLDALLVRMEKVEPTLKMLEGMQRGFVERNRPRPGERPEKLPSWSDIFGQLLERLDAIEKRVYAPPALRDPVASQTPLELRLKALEDRQAALTKELEAARKEIRRLRRDRTDRTL